MRPSRWDAALRVATRLSVRLVPAPNLRNRRSRKPIVDRNVAQVKDQGH